METAIAPGTLRLYDEPALAHGRAYNAGWTLAEQNAPEFMEWVWSMTEGTEFAATVMAATSGDGEPFVALMQNLADRFAQRYAERNWERFTDEVLHRVEQEEASL